MAHNDTDNSPSARVAVAGRIVVSSERGQITADLAQTSTIRPLLAILPLTVEMRDHLRQQTNAWFCAECAFSSPPLAEALQGYSGPRRYDRGQAPGCFQ